MRKSPSLLETLTNATATSEQKRVRPEEKEDYMEVRKEDQRDPDEKVIEIEIERLRDFKNHPFKVQADSQMKELQESIKKYGILNPLIVRPRPEGFYEIISGHRRKYAAQQRSEIYVSESAIQ